MFLVVARSCRVVEGDVNRDSPKEMAQEIRGFLVWDVLNRLHQQFNLIIGGITLCCRSCQDILQQDELKERVRRNYVTTLAPDPKLFLDVASTSPDIISQATTGKSYKQESGSMNII